MRKVKSCPQLAGMDLAFSCGLRCKTLSSASLLTKRVSLQGIFACLVEIGF